MNANTQARSGQCVTHVATGAKGEVVKGGFRPRVRWRLPGGGERISRVDIGELRERERERADGPDLNALLDAYERSMRT